MSAIQEKIPTKRFRNRKIPDSLIYETMDGKPVYYKNYKDVLKKTKTPEEIMGCSGLQAAIIEVILHFLHTTLNRKQYRILTNEVGIHINTNDNLSVDIAIFEQNAELKLDNNYISKAPTIAIEVDTNADLTNFDETFHYIETKSRKLLEFGTETVIWIFSKHQKTMVFKNPNIWTGFSWNETIELPGKFQFNLNELLKEDGIAV